MPTKRKRTVPADLKPAGKRLWKAITGDVQEGWSLDAKDYTAITEAARIADQLAALEKDVKRDGHTVLGSTGQPRVHPAIGEMRQLRETQHRLLRTVELEAPNADASARSRFASEAARARWGRGQATVKSAVD
jgi:hypothetical protein